MSLSKLFHRYLFFKFLLNFSPICLPTTPPQMRRHRVVKKNPNTCVMLCCTFMIIFKIRSHAIQKDNDRQNNYDYRNPGQKLSFVFPSSSRVASIAILMMMAPEQNRSIMTIASNWSTRTSE